MPKKAQVLDEVPFVDSVGYDYLRDLDYLRGFDYYTVTEEDLMKLKALYMKYVEDSQKLDWKKVDSVVTEKNVPYIIGMLNNRIRKKSEKYSSVILAKEIEEVSDRKIRDGDNAAKSGSPWDE